MSMKICPIRSPKQAEVFQTGFPIGRFGKIIHDSIVCGLLVVIHLPESHNFSVISTNPDMFSIS